MKTKTLLCIGVGAVVAVGLGSILLTLMADSKGLGHHEIVESYENPNFTWNEDTDCYYVVANSKRYDVSRADTKVVYNYYSHCKFDITKYSALIGNNTCESYKLMIMVKYGLIW